MKYADKTEKIADRMTAMKLNQTETKTKWLYTVSKILDSEWRNTDRDATETIKWWQKKTRWFVLKLNIKN